MSSFLFFKSQVFFIFIIYHPIKKVNIPKSPGESLWQACDFHFRDSKKAAYRNSSPIAVCRLWYLMAVMFAAAVIAAAMSLLMGVMVAMHIGIKVKLTIQ